MLMLKLKQAKHLVVENTETVNEEPKPEEPKEEPKPIEEPKPKPKAKALPRTKKEIEVVQCEKCGNEC